MGDRVSRILKNEAVGLSWLGTFHSICAKLLRNMLQQLALILISQ